MRKHLLLAAVLFCSVFCAGFAYRQGRPQIEYKFEHSPSEKKVNELGSQGWELVAIQSPSQNIVVATYVFKRSR
jgi:hypothetical protein